MATIRIGSRLKCRGMVEVNKVCVCNLKVQLTLISEIKELQKTDGYLQSDFDKCQKGEISEFHVKDDGIRCYNCRVRVLDNLE